MASEEINREKGQLGSNELRKSGKANRKLWDRQENDCYIVHIARWKSENCGRQWIKHASFCNSDLPGGRMRAVPRIALIIIMARRITFFVVTAPAVMIPGIPIALIVKTAMISSSSTTVMIHTIAIVMTATNGAVQPPVRGRIYIRPLPVGIKASLGTASHQHSLC